MLDSPEDAGNRRAGEPGATADLITRQTFLPKRDHLLPLSFRV
jgi:hypothetical protein